MIAAAQSVLRTLRRLVTSLRQPRMKPDNTLARGQLATGRMLAVGILKGYWTLEQFDAPPKPSGDVRSVNIPNKAPKRNLAREWIQANPKEWRELQEKFYTDDTLARPPWMA